jgi:hypothetical protein
LTAEEREERARGDHVCTQVFRVTRRREDFILNRDIVAVAAEYQVDPMGIIVSLLRQGARPQIKGLRWSGEYKLGARVLGVELAPRTAARRAKGIGKARWELARALREQDEAAVPHP